MAINLSPETAHNIMSRVGMTRETNFFSLRTDQVAVLLLAANEHGYRKPKYSNDSKGRQFFAYVQKAARQPI